jgi:hypothetical protein
MWEAAASSIQPTQHGSRLIFHAVCACFEAKVMELGTSIVGLEPAFLFEPLTLAYWLNI